MKINKSVERALFVMLMLALQIDHKPVKSKILSDRLDVSDSYLKKILRQLVVAGLVTSSASKDGGYQLAKSIEEITLYDVYVAVENGHFVYDSGQLARNLFTNEAHIQESEQKITNTFDAAFESFGDQLKELRLSDLLEDGKYENGWLDWTQNK